MGRKNPGACTIDFSDVVESCLDSILVHDVGGEIVYANKASAAAFHFRSPGVILGKSVLELFVESERAKYSARMKLLLETRQPFIDMEFRMLTRDGESFIASVCGYPIGDSKETQAALVLHDITARKLIEQGLKRQLEIARDEMSDLAKRKQESYHIDTRQVHSLVVVYGSYVMKAALKELVDDPHIDNHFISYQEEYEIKLVKKLNADVVVFAFLSGGDIELEDIKELVRHNKRLRVLAVCMQLDDDRARELIKAGIHGLIAREDEIKMVPVAINSIMLGELWCSRAVLQSVIHNDRSFSAAALAEGATGSLLTEREQEILQLIARSYRNKEIAEKLGISYHTVVTHIYNIYRKLDVNSRIDAIHYAISKGLISF